MTRFREWLLTHWNIELIGLGLLMSLTTADAARAETYHVDAQAGKEGEGNRQAPFKKIQQAADVMKPGDVCLIHEGTYREAVRPARSGTESAPLVFKPYRDARVTISGTERVTGWQRTDGSIYRASVKLRRGAVNQVFVDGKMMCRARWPNVRSTGPDRLLEYPVAEMDKGTTRTKLVDSQRPDLDLDEAQVWVSSHKRWFSWTGAVKGSGENFLRIEDNGDEKGNNVARPGGKYYLFGARSLLDTGNEWYYDEDQNRLYVWMPNGGRPGNTVTVRRRDVAFNLRDRSHVTVRDVDMHAGRIRTSASSRNLVFDGITAKYVHHSMRAEDQYGSQRSTGIVLRGAGHVIRNSEIAYSSGSLVVLRGDRCRIINNYIHDADYIGSYASPVVFAGGRKHVVSHNTIARAGRTAVGVGHFYDSLLQYNDVHHAGYLTYDLGLTYGNGVEGGNSEVRYNWLHDNVAGHLKMGLYFDHGVKNVIYHHNAIWNVDRGMQNNLYGNYLLYYNNTVAGAKWGYRSAWAAAQKKRLDGCHLFNNVAAGGVKIDAAGIKRGANHWNFDEVVRHRYLRPGSAPVDDGIVIPGITDGYQGPAPDAGAYEVGARRWAAGHDFANPPEQIDTSRTRPPRRNLVQNAAFFEGRLTHWCKKGPNVRVERDFHNQWETEGTAMMGGHSVRFGRGANRLQQTITNLEPGKTYELMGKFRVPSGSTGYVEVDEAAQVERDNATVTGSAPKWGIAKLRFTTGPNQTRATIYLAGSEEGPAPVFADDPGLQLIEPRSPK